MRIISGELGGRRITAPKGRATRPTSDRVREALFSILGSPPRRAVVLDLFAGAGTLGLEALSRGASTAVFVDGGKPAARILKKNIAALSVGSRCEVVVSGLPAALERRPIARRLFDWVFVDPPYASDVGAETLAALGRGELLAADALVVLEHDRRNPPDHEVGCLVRTDCRRYGDTEISFYRRGSS